jgi:hypothetical protein
VSQVGLNQTFSNRELALVFLFSLALCMFLLMAVSHIGYDLFWEQIGAGLLLYVTVLASISTIARKQVSIVTLIQFFLLFSLIFFPLMAYTKNDHESLIVDDFEIGTWGWFASGARGVNSTITEETRLSPQGSWHMVWSVSNACRSAPEGWWGAIDTCLPTFSLRDYESIEFWYRQEIRDYGFLLQIRCPDHENYFVKILGGGVKWTPVSLRLPRANDLGDFSNVGNPDFQAPAHIAFSNDCNETYHFDCIQLTSTTFLEQHGIELVFITEAVLGGLFTLTLVPTIISRRKKPA